MLSHSNGSVRTSFTLHRPLADSINQIVHGWLLKSVPDLVVRSCFVDPVCFCLWEVSIQEVVRELC